jgi:hypothetical protein
MINSDRKKKALRIWNYMVKFVRWADSCGIPEMLVKAIIEISLWWLIRKMG